ncbi:permease prefix domain 1-containing protein [Protaetiibacter larvae]|uniref:Uncharacterized protein n=1 Tax=Protaetiibacter larvae TaxID=2592654 RepID=A0A5C1Y8C3_9MICO|nr:permease prefix domain 1-containing protein [Protaetiibacter larvae]QEO09419.1 hypothetical protein FLP23_04995 [Protaetiibacter larvae]
MTATSLTDRYVAAVVRSLPERQRADIEQELRALLADAIDDRVEAGAEATTAERDAIVELGDPIRLAAGYANRPLHLVGPVFYADWKRLLTVLELTVVPIVAAVLAVIGALRGGAPIEVVGSVVSTALTVGVHLAFWVTLAFAVLERTPGIRDKALVGWSPDMLPESPRKAHSLGEVIGQTIFGVLVITALLLVPFVSPYRDADGAPIPLLDPWIFTSGLVVVLVAVPVLQIVADLVKLVGRWTLPRALVAILVDLIGAAAIIAIGAGGRALNPAFREAADWPESIVPVVNIALVAVGVLTIVTSLWEQTRGIRRS